MKSPADWIAAATVVVVGTAMFYWAFVIATGG